MKIGIIFDLDGTLLDTLEDLADATNYALAQFGCPTRSLEYIRSVIGNGALRQITRSMPEDTQLDPQEVLAVYKKYYYSHCNVKTKPYSGILQALEQLGKKYPLAIVTNKPHGAAEPLCAAHFPGIFTLGETPDLPRKPDAAMVRYAMEKLGVDTCIYVGDSEVDIRTAESCGVPCLTVLWGLRSREELEKAGANYFCEDPTQMTEAIGKMLEG